MGTYSDIENEVFLAAKRAREREVAPRIADHTRRLSADPRYWEPEPDMPDLEVPQR
jgi:hypothetical protein